MSQQVYEREQTVAASSNGLKSNGAQKLSFELSSVAPQRRGSEPYDAALMRLRLRMNLERGMGYALGVTSCARDSGVSTFTANLAIRAADLQFGPVLLVDAQPKRGAVATLFGVETGPGLGEVLTGRAPLEQGIQQSAVSGLDLMTLGGKGLLERAGVETERIDTLLKELRSEYPIVFFDFPSIDNLTPTLLLGQQMDGLLLTVRAERIRKRQAEVSLRRLKTDGINVIGAVMTRRRNYLPAWLERRL